jgi:tetratricopeptide (TPR) repeat protein
MTSAENKAVFLSYASQDAEAAKRIAEALRAAGVEVWFDVEGGLETGDEWDAKIRRQIKECVLFVPVISANTQARHEGYFRIEWDLAAERARGIASGVAFILPVVIDDTREPDALVPDRFRSVQWTRVRAGELTPEQRTKFAKLWSHRIGVLQHRAAGEASGGAPLAGLPPAVEPKRARPFGALVIGGALAAAVVVGGWFWQRRGPVEPSSRPAVAAPVHPAVATMDKDLVRAEQLMTAPNAIVADVMLAEDLCKGVLAQQPTDVAATVMMARVQTYLLLRGFDRSEARFALAKQFSERALALAPDDVEAQAALGTYLFRRNIELPRAAKLFRTAIAARPAEPRFHLMLDNVLSDDPAVPRAELLASTKRTADRFPTDALAQYEAARHFRDAAILEETDRYLDLAIKHGPIANAIIAKARLALTVRGETAVMRKLLDQLPERYRTNDRAVFSEFVYALAGGDYELGLRALRAKPEPWMVDFEFTGPKALLEGELLLLQGKAELARLRFEAAHKEYAQHAAVNNVGFRSMWLEAWLLARLGRVEEARTRNAVIFPEYERPFQMYLGQGWWFNPVALNLMLGERAKAYDLMREAVDFQEGRRILRVALGLDPRLAAYRTDPQFRALLDAPDSTKSAKIALSTRDWPKKAELKRAIALIDGLEAIRDDFVLAEQITTRELDLNPADPDAVTVMARIQSQYLLRGFDRRDARAALAGQYSERAVQLAPDEPEALFALANYLGARGVDRARAETLIKKACVLDPGQPRYWRVATLNTNDSVAALALAEENVRRFPADPLTRYDLSIRYRNLGRWADFERETDATLALAPVANTIVWKARAMLGLHGDLAGMRTWLDKVPSRVSGQERPVFSRFLYAALSSDFDYGFVALRSYTEPWFLDVAEYGGPAALLQATLLDLQGKPALARVQYEAALVEVQRQKLAMPTDLWVRRAEIWVMRGLGRLDEARALNRAFVEIIPRPIVLSPVGGWFFSPTASSLLLEDRSLALTLLREGANGPFGREALRVHFRTDPRMAPFRDDPEIAALLAEPDAKAKSER